MPKLPVVSPEKFIKVLLRLDFFECRQVGSHKLFKNSDGVRVTVPYHRGTNIHPKILKMFLRDAHLSIDEFVELL